MTHSDSVDRVIAAAQKAGLAIEVIWFKETAKTAQAAADLIGCTTAQIANSLIFEGSVTRNLHLLLTSGGHRVDLDFVKDQIGEELIRADAKRIRNDTGFAIGGVAPIGHLTPIKAWMDRTLFDHKTVWAAAGRAETVFEILPADLQRVSSANLFDATRI